MSWTQLTFIEATAKVHEVSTFCCVIRKACMIIRDRRLFSTTTHGDTDAGNMTMPPPRPHQQFRVSDEGDGFGRKVSHCLTMSMPPHTCSRASWPLHRSSYMHQPFVQEQSDESSYEGAASWVATASVTERRLDWIARVKNSAVWLVAREVASKGFVTEVPKWVLEAGQAGGRRYVRLWVGWHIFLRLDGCVHQPWCLNTNGMWV